jgi:hypothetical protein
MFLEISIRGKGKKMGKGEGGVGGREERGGGGYKC